MHSTTVNSNLTSLYKGGKLNVIENILQHKSSCVDVRWTGPFLTGQIDLTTASNPEYITNFTCYPQVTEEFFAAMVGSDVQPAVALLGFVVDQGGDVFDAVKALHILPTFKVHRARLEHGTHVGIGNRRVTYDSRCKNKPIEKLMKRLAALLEVFSHSAVNNDELKLLQELKEELGT